MSKRTKKFVAAAIAGGIVYFIGQSSLVNALAFATFALVLIVLDRTESQSGDDDL